MTDKIIVEITPQQIKDLIEFYADVAEDFDTHVDLVYEDLDNENPIHFGAEAVRQVIKRTIIKMYPLTLDDIYNTPEYDGYMHDHLDPNNLLLDGKVDRMERRDEYDKHGGEGSTHAESIEDNRSFIRASNYPDYIKDSMLAELEVIEKRHEEAGDLDEIIN